MLGEIIGQCAGVRRPGAAALDLAYVAAGFSDGFFEAGLQPWDVAAGSLLVTEAGGLVGNFTGQSEFLHQGECVAANPRIYGQMISTLGKYSKFADAGDKAKVRIAANEQALEKADGDVATDAVQTPAAPKTTLKSTRIKPAAKPVTAAPVIAATTDAPIAESSPDADDADNAKPVIPAAPF